MDRGPALTVPNSPEIVQDSMFTFVLKKDDGTETVLEADTRDVVRWEQETGLTLVDIENRNRFEDLYRLSWFAARRTGLIPKSTPLEEYIDLFQIDMSGDADEADPTQKAASTD